MTPKFIIAPKVYTIISNSEADGLAKLKSFTEDAIKKGYTVIGLSASLRIVGIVNR